MNQTAKHLRIYFFYLYLFVLRLIIFLHQYSYKNVQAKMIHEKWTDAGRPLYGIIIICLSENKVFFGCAKINTIRPPPPPIPLKIFQFYLMIF